MRRGRVQYHEAGTIRAEILIDAGGVAGRRIDPDYRWVEVELADARVPELAPDFASEGLCFVVAPSCVGHPDAFAKLQAAYELELQALLERELGARECVVFDHTVRGELGESGTRPPSYHVHCDYNEHSAAKRLRELVGPDRAELWLGSRFAVVNVWRPLLAPVERAPIAFVRPASMAAQDWVDVDIVFPTRRGQIVGVAHNPGHRWVYLSAMRPAEVAVFCVYANTGVGGVAHAAVELVPTPLDARPRASLESRVFVRL